MLRLVLNTLSSYLSHLRVVMTSCVTRLAVGSDVIMTVTGMGPGTCPDSIEYTSPSVEKTGPPPFGPSCRLSHEEML